MKNYILRQCWSRFLVISLCVLGGDVLAAQQCHPQSVGTCALPFPSNFYTRPDPASATGLQVDLKGTLFSPEAEAQVEGYGSAEVYNGRSGFSAAAPVLFELRKAIDESSLPENGGAAVRVFNVTTGQQAAVRASVLHYANDERFAGKQAHVVEVYPRSRYQFGHRYIAVITKQLRPDDGSVFAAAPGLSASQSALDYVVSQGIPADQVLSLTEFTVADEYSTTSEFFQLVDQVEQEAHPVRNLDISYTPLSAVTYATVRGQLRLSDFRDPVHGQVRYQPGVNGRHYWTDFVLKIPPQARYGKVPVAIYGHGLSVFKETADFTVLATNANRGVATIYIDQPYHGSRIAIDGDDISSLPTVDNIRRIAGMVAQSSLDMHSVLVSVKTALADLNVVPRNNAWNRFFYRDGIRSADLDTEQILYEGTSLGGVLGASFLATARDVKGGFMQVTGVGMANILSHSNLFERLEFSNLIPDAATGGDAALFFHALQTEVDIADAINFVHYLRDGGYGRQPKAAVIQYGVGDGVVFNPSSHAFAELVDMPLVGRVHRDVPHLRRSDDFEKGYGVVQTPALLPTFHILDSLLGHASFMRIDAQVQLNRWLDQVTEPPR